MRVKKRLTSARMGVHDGFSMCEIKARVYLLVLYCILDDLA